MWTSRLSRRHKREYETHLTPRILLGQDTQRLFLVTDGEEIQPEFPGEVDERDEPSLERRASRVDRLPGGEPGGFDAAALRVSHNDNCINVNIDEMRIIRSPTIFDVKTVHGVLDDGQAAVIGMRDHAISRCKIKPWMREKRTDLAMFL
jgi:hypothetical protein